MLLLDEGGGPPRVIGGVRSANDAPEIEFSSDGGSILACAPQSDTIQELSIANGRS